MPDTPMRVVHYGTAALNQMTFSSKSESDRQVAQRLVDFYLTLFKMILDGNIGFRKDMERKVRGNSLSLSMRNSCFFLWHNAFLGEFQMLITCNGIKQWSELLSFLEFVPPWPRSEHLAS